MSVINSVVELHQEGEVAVISLNSPPVNALSAVVRDGLAGGFRAAAENPEVKAIVLICEGRTFIAGADLTEFGGERKGTPLTEVLDLIEFSAKPVVAAIHGTALGGGLEVALCCHYRVAVPSALLGLPEVTVGLLPGAGGTQRLPRIVGVEKALELITFGQRIPAAECEQLGIVDALMPEGALRTGAIDFARQLIIEQRPLRRLRDEDQRLGVKPGDNGVFERFAAKHARKLRGRDAPQKIFEAISAAVNLPFDQAMQLEQRLFQELLAGDQSKALRYAFFAERQAQRIPDVPAETPTRKINRVGVIGAGTMGGGIAMNFANIGLPVTIVERDQQALDRGLAVVRKNYERSAARGGLTAGQVEQRMALLSGALDNRALADCDLVIEAVFEQMEVKQAIFRELDGICKPGAILATNTSYLDVNEIAAVTRRPEDVIGLHFFSPANVMRLVEIVRGSKTAKDVIATSMALAKKIGKAPVLVGVCHGFVGNRMLELRGREASKLLMEGAMPWDIDRVLYDFGFPMGPFAMHDLAGLDLRWKRETSRGETPVEVLCEMDRRGQKTGAGYYDYDEQRNATPSAVTEDIIQRLRRERGITPRTIADQEILERCLFAMINEGLKILGEGIAIRPSDIDVIWLQGYGWPSHRGGPMHYGDLIGTRTLLERLKHYQLLHGDDFAPATALVRLATEGRAIADF